MTLKDCAKEARLLQKVRDKKTGMTGRIYTVGLFFDDDGNDHEYVEILDNRARALYTALPDNVEIVKEEKEK